MRLSQMSPQARVTVVAIEDPATRRNLRTMGVSEGTVLVCLKRLRRGPLVVRTGGVTLALGHELANRIEVSHCSDGGGGRGRNLGRHRNRGRHGRRHRKSNGTATTGD